MTNLVPQSIDQEIILEQKAPPPGGSRTGYRPDIDGLRAVAVLLVVLYHLGIRSIKGGFVGVDIFFVISGYLISAIIISENKAGKFSLGRFYERRIRRIGPALLVMIAATCVLAYLYLLPAEMTEFAQSLLAATLSASNIFFWNKSGYFDTSSETQPLLHTWSLAVEEQFYLIFPLLIMAVYRWAPTKIKTIVLTIAALSFGVSIYQVAYSPTSAFFLPVSRAWELLMGTIVYLKVFPALRLAWQRNLAAAIGAVMIGLSGFGYTPKTPFPGMAAVLPCLGAALIIAAGMEGTSLVGRALSLKPAAGIGLISYSLYLWHWPILVFQKLGTVLVKGGGAHTVQAVVLLVSLAAAYLSWRFVEQPFRAGHLKIPRSTLFRFAAACMAGTIAVSVGVLSAHGLPFRYPSEAVRVAGYLEYNARDAYRLGTCFITSKDALSSYDRSTCLREETGKKNVLIIGDSHAAQLWWGMAKVFPQMNFMEATASGCEPTIEQARRSDAQCTQLMKSMYSDFLQTHHVDEVLVAGRWQLQDLPRVRATLSWFRSKGIRAVLFGPMVQYDSSLPRLLARAIQLNDPQIPQQHRLMQFEDLDHAMSVMSAQLNVPYVSFFKTLCSDAHCIEYAQNVPLQSDYSHLTREGSVLFADLLRQSEQGKVL